MLRDSPDLSHTATCTNYHLNETRCEHGVQVEDEDREVADTAVAADNDDKTGIAEPGSFELTNKEVLALVQSMGFEIISQSALPTSAGGYIQQPDSMLQNRYSCSHWVAKKVA